MSRSLAVTLNCIVLTSLFACGGYTPPPPPDPNCRGAACISWTMADAEYCQQFDPKKKNRAYNAKIGDSAYSTPINVFYRTKQWDAGGNYIGETDENRHRVTSTTQRLPVCRAAIINGSIHTQKPFILCQTNRALPNGATSADCVAAEQMALLVEPLEGKVTSMSTMRSSPEGVALAPRILQADQDVDCSAACSGKTDEPCVEISDVTINSGLLNLIGQWDSNKQLTKAQAMAALGLSSDACARGDVLVQAGGAINNEGDSCIAPLNPDAPAEDAFSLIIEPAVRGRMERAGGTAFVALDATAGLLLKTPPDLSEYGGRIQQMAAPRNSRFIDMRTDGACWRFHEK